MGYVEGTGQTYDKMMYTFYENREQGKINKTVCTGSLRTGRVLLWGQTDSKLL